MTTHEFTAAFTVRGPEGANLAEAAENFMEELLGLEKSACGIHSSSVSVDLEQTVVEVEVCVDGDFDTALAVANSCIRAAIHATGGHTPDWDVPASQVTAEALVSA